MAGRPRNPDMQYTIRLHLDKNKYRYASTVVEKTSKKTGTIYKYYNNWGTVTEDLKFIPAPKYILATTEEKSKLIFPDNWDISEIYKYGVTTKESQSKEPELTEQLTQDIQDTVQQKSSETNIPTNSNPDGKNNAENAGEIKDSESQLPADDKESKEYSEAENLDTCKEYQNKLYGAFWILENLANNCGLFDDLYDTFNGNYFYVNAVISLAIFPYLAKRSLNRFAKWQRSNKTLLDDELSSSFITKFTQSITDNHRMNLIKHRVERQPPNAHASCDSTTRSGYGKMLAELRWGKNKDDDDLPATLEVTVYSLTTHEPIYYRTFAGSNVDMSTIRIILSDLKELNIKDVFFIFDRGYISKTNIAMFVVAGLPFMMCAKTGQSPVAPVLLDIKYDADGLPINMEYDKRWQCYCTQIDIPKFNVKMDDDSSVTIEGLKANVFINMQKRFEKLEEIRSKIDNEEKDLTSQQEKGEIPSDIKKHNALYVFHIVYLEDVEVIDNNGVTTVIKKLMFKKNEKKIAKAKSQAGVFSSVIYGLSLTAKEALRAYKERDEHEKSWNQMKCQMEFNTQDNSSEDGKDGRRFILFAGMIIVSKLKSGWKNTELSMQYNSAYDLIDEMEHIRYCEYKNTPSKMTSFTEKQVAISMSLGINPPDECIPTTMLEKIKRQRKKQEKEAILQ